MIPSRVVSIGILLYLLKILKPRSTLPIEFRIYFLPDSYRSQLLSSVPYFEEMFRVRIIFPSLINKIFTVARS